MSFINSPIPREYLYYGFWSATVLFGLIAAFVIIIEGGLITYFLWKLASR